MEIPLRLGIAFAIIGICVGAPSTSIEEEARNFIQQLSDNTKYYYKEHIRRVLRSGSMWDRDFETSVLQMKSETSKGEALYEDIEKFRKFDVTKFHDEDLKHIFKMIQRSFDTISFEENWISLQYLYDTSTYAKIGAYRNSTVKLSYPHIQQIMAISNDPVELKYYWTEWKKKLSMWAIPNFIHFSDVINQVANASGSTLIQTWLCEYNLNEMELIMDQIKPIYEQLHGFIRNQLHKKYGDISIKLNEPIPDYLFQHVLAQNLTQNNIIDELFSNKNLPPYEEFLQKNGYTNEKLYKTADQFVQSLGFEPFPRNYWCNNFQQNTDSDEMDCQPTIFDDSEDVYMAYCHKIDFETFLRAHGYMAQIYYAREKKNLPAYFFPSEDLKYSVSKAVILSAWTPTNLNGLGLMNDFVFTDEFEMNRLLRMSTQILLKMPLYFVHTQLMADFLEGRIKKEHLNIHYWNLMEKYAGVGPSADSTSKSVDMPYEFYKDLRHNLQAQKFYTEILGFQLYKKFCKISGKYQRDYLNTCDFHGSKQVGDALKQIMQFGSSKPLREILKTIFPEGEVFNAESLLEYFGPLQTWLNAKHKDLNVRVGWNHSNKKIESVLFEDDMGSSD